MLDLFSLKAYHFTLPQELIAQRPADPRDSSRLMLINPRSGEIGDYLFRDLVDILHEKDQLVFNDTKVLPARLIGKRSSGGAVEILLVKAVRKDCWLVLARPGRKVKEGTRIFFSESFYADVVESREEGTKVVHFFYYGNFIDRLEEYGKLPLPPYIKNGSSKHYQTVFAANPGAIAAPTAGLHFTPELLQRLKSRGVLSTAVTLHIGLGTFQPVQVEDIRSHPMHTERFAVSSQACEDLQREVGRRVVVGTTCCRVLESLPTISPGEYETDIFIYPGYRFKRVEHLLTNFHLPSSTLLMLVSAFAGYELIKEAYSKAVERKYRFFTYGDAMLIL